MAAQTENTPEPDPQPQPEDEQLTEKEKYFKSLKAWLQKVQMAQTNAYLPYYFMACQMLFNAQPPSSGQYLNNNYQGQGPQWPYYQVNRNGNNERSPGENHRNPRRETTGGVQYYIPPIWKRFIAEVIDFLFFSISKALILFIAVYYFGFVEFEEFSISNTMNLFKQITEDQDFAFELTTEIILLELMNRLGACFFETIFLTDFFGGALFGATPGKVIMGLRVVTATSITAVENRDRETVLIYPAATLSLRVALVRSIIKNTLITLIFPVCMFTQFSQFNRATYDVVCNVIVVETIQP